MAEGTSFEDLDIALAHWHINAWGGAEYLVTQLADALGIDRVYTIGEPSPDENNPYGDVEFYDVIRDLSPHSLRRFQAKFGRAFEYALWEDVDWREYGHADVLVTSGATTRAVITPDDTLHINYCHSPPRWFYDLYHDRKTSMTSVIARPLIRHLRTRDAAVDPRVDRYFANSPIIARRLRKYYNRDSNVLYPPVDLDCYYDGGDGGFYLHLGRLDTEKGIEAIVEAFSNTDYELVLAGGAGDAYDSIQGRIKRASNVTYRGFVPGEEKYELLANCRAVVFNGRNEDFGIVPIEANASGKPCLARSDGFPGLYIEDGVNGYLHDGSPESIRSVLERFEAEWGGDIDAEILQSFSAGKFRENCRDKILNWYDDFTVSI